MSDFGTDIPDLSEFGLDGSELFGSSDSTDTSESEGYESSTDTENPVTDNLDTAEVTYFDWDTVADKPVRVKVQGDELEVPFKELRDGYMRQADYTRKTQELQSLRQRAEWADQVQQAFESDPLGTLRAFEDAFGQPQAASQIPQFDGIDDPELAPIVQAFQAQQAELAELRQQMSSQMSFAEQAKQERMVQEARSELDQVKAKYPDVDVVATLQLAADRGLPIEDAHLLLEGRKTVQNRSSQAEASVKAADIARIEAAKEQASQAVNSRRGGRGVEAVPEHGDFGDLLETMFKTS